MADLRMYNLQRGQGDPRMVQDTLRGLLDLTPAGDAMAVQEGLRGLLSGDYPAAIGGAVAALPMVPGTVGKSVKEAIQFATPAAKAKFDELTNFVPGVSHGMMDILSETGSLKATIQHLRNAANEAPNAWMRNHEEVAYRNAARANLADMLERGEIKLGK